MNCGKPKHDGDCECHIDGIVLDDFTRERTAKDTMTDTPKHTDAPAEKLEEPRR